MSMRQIFEIPGYKEILDGLDSLWKRAVLRTTSKGPSQSFTNTRNTTDGYSAARILPSAKAFGKAVTKRKQNKLWGRYVPADYITLDGSSYLDLAPLTTAEEIEIIFRRSAYTSTNFLFGTNPDAPTSTVVAAWYGSTGFVMQNGSERKTATVDTNWHTVKFTSTKTYLDGVEIGDAGTRTYFQNLVIGSARALNSAGTVETRCFRGDISRVKVGNKIFVAGKDVTANKFGLIDPAENKFYGNSGTGTITGGDLIQPISYAESDGTAWVNTDYVLTGDEEIEFDFQYMGNYGSSAKMFSSQEHHQSIPQRVVSGLINMLAQPLGNGMSDIIH